MAAASEAVEQAQFTDLNGNGERVSVMVASGIGGIITLSEQIGVMDARGPRRVSPFLVPMMLPDMASGHVSMSLGARGPNYSTVSACASGGDAIGQGQALLRMGVADAVIAGGDGGGDMSHRSRGVQLGEGRFPAGTTTLRRRLARSTRGATGFVLGEGRGPSS